MVEAGTRTPLVENLLQHRFQSASAKTEPRSEGEVQQPMKRPKGC